MQNKRFLTILFVLFINQTFSQNECLKNDIQTYYLDNCEKRGDNTEKTSLIIYFEYGFNEQTEVYINDNLLLNKEFQQFESISSTNQAITCDFVKYGNNPNLKVNLVTSKITLDVILNNNYNFLFINKLKGKWSLIYRNTAIARE